MTERTERSERTERVEGAPRPSSRSSERSSSASNGSARLDRPASAPSRTDGKPRQNPYATLRALKWLVGLALVLSVSCLVTIAMAVASAGSGPAASAAELQATTACAKAKLVGEYVRQKMSANLHGTQPLRRSDVVSAERSCETDVSTGDVNLLIEQANALNVPGLAPAAQTPPPQPSQAPQ